MVLMIPLWGHLLKLFPSLEDQTPQVLVCPFHVCWTVRCQAFLGNFQFWIMFLAKFTVTFANHLPSPCMTWWCSKLQRNTNSLVSKMQIAAFVVTIKMPEESCDTTMYTAGCNDLHFQWNFLNHYQPFVIKIIHELFITTHNAGWCAMTSTPSNILKTVWLSSCQVSFLVPSVSASHESFPAAAAHGLDGGQPYAHT